MAMRAREGAAVRQFIGDMGPLAQMNPRYLDRLDPDAIAEALHDASPSLPARILRSRDDADELARARAEQEAQAKQMQMMEQAGGVAKDLGITLDAGGMQ